MRRRTLRQAATWSRHLFGGRFCWWSRSHVRRDRLRRLEVVPNGWGRSASVPPAPFVWRVTFETGGTLEGGARSLFAAMAEARLRAFRPKRLPWRPVFRRT